ncbi:MULTISPECIES: tol-pal system YbgF family protein [unclassified Duganella]|uniref:tetratricopeptide repeat protein n=1 Tax=unclassified Duganella TaxID=2636909 RepID=UPI001E44F3DF|nr:MULTISPECIES: tetratricopeptide repeat protein [unclassified Duganella]
MKRLSAQGDQLAKTGKFSEAIPVYWQAWDILPEPKQDWNAALWLLAAIGDANFGFKNKDYVACRDNLSYAMRVPGAIGNPFLHLRLGQCQFELGNMGRAADELARAYIPEGRAIFKEDDPKYLGFIKSKLKPPPAGWPKGW